MDAEMCERGELGGKRKRGEAEEGTGHLSASGEPEQPDEVSAIDSLSIVLKKQERKEAYLLVGVENPPNTKFEDAQLEWMSLKVRDDGDVSISRVHDTMRGQASGAPSELRRLTRYSCIAYKSMIIIAGGLLISDDIILRGSDADGEFCNVSNDREISYQVFIYHTLDSKWETLPPIKKPRVAPIIVGAGDKIFIFGGWVLRSGGNEEVDKKLLRKYGEYYDLSEHPSSWKYFPQPLPRQFLYSPMAHSDVVVYEDGSVILFWLQNCVLGSFNYNTWKWNFYHPQHPLCKPPYWGDSPVILGHFLFWHDQANIYAYNLLMLDSKATPISVYKFDDNLDKFSYPKWRQGSTVLFHPGNDQLCLFWWEKEKKIRYLTFRLKIAESDGGATLCLVLDTSGLLPNHIPSVNHVVRVSYPVG